MRLLAGVLLGASALRDRRKAAGDCYSKYDGMLLVKMNTRVEQYEEVFNALQKLGCSETSEERTEITAICDKGSMFSLRAMFGTRHVNLVHQDAGEFYRSSSGVTKKFNVSGPSMAVSTSFYAEWRDYEERMSAVAAAVDKSSACSLETFGTTIDGLPMKAVRLTGAGWSPGKPRFVANFQIHAREWVSGMAGVFAVEAACERAAQNPNWLAGMEVVLVPTLNPDGTIFSEVSDRMWRKNRRINSGSSCKGVDLNRNWDPAWGERESTSSNKCQDVYFGTGPFSEPEVQALKGVIDEAPVTVHLDIHAYAGAILKPWSYTYTKHPDDEEINRVGEQMRAAMQAATGNRHRYGGNELLGPASGACPDYSTLTGAYGFTIELRPEGSNGGGFAPPASEILPTSLEAWAAIEAAIAYTKSRPDPTLAPPTPAPVPTPAPACPSKCNGWRCRYTSGCDGCC